MVVKMLGLVSGMDLAHVDVESEAFVFTVLKEMWAVILINNDRRRGVLASVATTRTSVLQRSIVGVSVVKDVFGLQRFLLLWHIFNHPTT